MKLIIIEQGKYYVDGYPQITIERWRVGRTYWDLFVDGNVHPIFGTSEKLQEIKDKLKETNPDLIIKTSGR